MVSLADTEHLNDRLHHSQSDAYEIEQASESDIEQSFRSGDNDGDDTLSVSEASDALEKLSGKSVDTSTIESACSSCGVDTSREMDCTYKEQLEREPR
jgi:hypothetical protein